MMIYSHGVMCQSRLRMCSNATAEYHGCGITLADLGIQNVMHIHQAAASCGRRYRQ